MLVKALLIASSLMMADGRQLLRNHEERSLGWAGDGNSAVPIKVVREPVSAIKKTKGSGKKKTLVVRKKKKSNTKSKPAGVKPIKIKESKGKVANVRPAKKWGDDGFEPITTPRPTRKPIGKRWGDDGFEPITTPRPTRRPTRKPTRKPRTKSWGDDGFEPIVTPRPSRRPSPKPTKWGNDGYCMYRPNADFSMCTNDDDISSDYKYNTLEGCCRALFGKGECEYEDVCKPCEEQLFFFDGDKCANDIFIADAPAYGSAVACCNMNFGLGSFVNGGCDYIDVCLPQPVVTPAPTPCGDLLFFLDGNTCTNDIFIADTVAYNNPVICCNVNFGPGSIMNGDCNVIDICGPPPTPAPTPCGDQVFYFNGNVCSNEYDIADAPAYNSLMTCCNAIFGVGSFMNGQCMYVDECNPSPTPKPTKRPTPKPVPSPVSPAPTVCEDIMFYFDGSICTNEIYISNTAAYATVVACCNVNFGVGSYGNDQCDYYDYCSPPEPVETPEPTPSPTTCEERRWYITTGDGYTICSNGYDNTSKMATFDSLSDCCDALEDMCYYEDVCATPSPSYSPTAEATFGSTPTVSKETTGPPTYYNDRGN